MAGLCGMLVTRVVDLEPRSARGPDQSERGQRQNRCRGAGLGGGGRLQPRHPARWRDREGRREVDDLFGGHLQHNGDCQGEDELREAG